MTSVGQYPHAYALFAAGILAGVVTLVVLGRFRRYSRRVRLPFALLTLSGSIWATAYGFLFLPMTPSAELFYAQLAWAGAAVIPTVWLVFALVYAGEDQLLSTQMLGFLAVEPAVAIALKLTNASHGLLGSSLGPWRAMQPNRFAVPGADLFGPLGPDLVLVAHVVYGFGVAVTGVSVIARTYLKSSNIHRRQAGFLFVAGVIPLAALGGEFFFPFRINPVPVSIGVSSVVVLWALFRHQLFDITPIARDAILSEMRDAVVVLDEQDRIVESNGAASELLARPVSECVGEPVLESVRVPSEVQAVLAGRDRAQAVVEDDGTNRYFEVRSEPLGDQTRDRTRLLVFYDVTERRRTEEEFRALIENSRDVITVLNEDGERTYTSPSMTEVLGYQTDALVGEPVLDLVHPDDRDRVADCFDEVVSGDPPVRAEFRVRHKNGTWRRFETVGVNLLDDPAVGGVVLNSRDVTSRHRYEQRLRVLNRVLRHDLRNDMNVILGHADLLLDERIPAESKDHARTIKRKASSLVELGEQTRHIDTTLTRGPSGLEPVEVVERIEAQLDDIESDYPEAIVHRNLPDEMWVTADDLIESALKHLIDNALEHNDRVIPEVGVTVERSATSNDYVEIRIADNGPGVPDAELSVLESGTETPLQHISGLGLWLVQWIIDRSNGRLRFTENEPRGSVAIVGLRSADRAASASDGGTITGESETD
ncbi:histidine kinase N-terminal 7TM domain-containing protein [Haloferax volcanii]|uniref:histidine kinase N-terminal 7TM domain-containing protein n=1 Tax=Haloferax volcanii TaxID=2246 RepID=UPI00249A6AFB|nr:histidine kinase N-terminal 7TM domain-containing protein [Haloferax alexandrinus]WEL29285.1 Signal transduction histidine kinase, contains PAS domain [Haloferax alexandrinus]